MAEKANVNLVELISETVQLKKSGKEWQGSCPFHPDTKPSLSVNESKGVWICHSCNIGGTAYDWVMRRDNVDFATAKRCLDGYMPPQKTVIATYDYTDLKDKLLFQVVRYLPKSFSQRQPDGKGGWINNLKGVETVLYNLPSVSAADTVYLVEGEKDANRLIAEGLVATTSPGGASNWKPRLAMYLCGKKVIIIPDNDAAGELYVNQVILSLKNVAREIWLCRLPGLTDKGDVSDWLDQGNRVEDLEKHCQKPDFEPKLEIKGGVYEFAWRGFTATLSRVREDKHGGVSGEARVTTTLPEFSPVLVQSKLNLLSTRSQAELARRLVDKCPSQDWEYILESLCLKTIDALRQGDPAVELWTYEDVAPPKYLVHPLVAEGQPNFLYGPGGTAKSYVALLLATILQLGWQDNPFSWETEGVSYPVLYLDWETTKNETHWREKCLKNGLDLPDFPLAYRRCSQPLADDIEVITAIVESSGIKVLVIDSLAAACGGEITNEVQPATRFFAALRRLNLTSIIVAHTPRRSEGSEKEIYGSVFFTNYGRNNWEVKKTQQIGEDEFVVGLFHRKTNLSKLHKAIGLRFEFGDGWTKVKLVDLQATALSAALPISEQILSLLKHGALNTAEIIESLEITRSNADQSLKRLRDKGLVIRVLDGWGLPIKDEILI